MLFRSRRAYTREGYLHIANALKAVRPDIAITTDIIVGFPGETEADLEQTLSLMDAVQFDGSFSFLYSPRPYTSAARLPDPVAVTHKKAWLQRVQERQRAHSMVQNTQWLGKPVDLIIEQTADKADTAEGNELLHQGRSAYNKVVHFTGKTRYTLGQRVTVTVEHATPAALYGTAGDDYGRSLILTNESNRAYDRPV